MKSNLMKIVKKHISSKRVKEVTVKSYTDQKNIELRFDVIQGIRVCHTTKAKFQNPSKRF